MTWQRTGWVSMEFYDLPPSPNRTRRSSHWSARAAIDKRWRLLGWGEATNALRGAPAPMWERVSIRIRFYLPTKVRRDPGNLVGSEGLKALIDGIVDAGVMTDDNTNVIVQYGPFQFEYRKGRPGMLIEVGPAK